MRLGNGRRWERLLGAAASAWLAWTLAGVGGAARAADRTKAIDEKVADIARTTGLGRTTLEGVGLVVGLSGTGSDPKPSAYRERIKAEIQRNPDLDADAILGDPRKRVSMVLVRATIIAGMTPEDELNVEVLLPPGSETTSLAGGFLMETWLYEGLMATGGTLEGKKWVKALGPIITGTAEDPTDEKAGRVLGGGRIKEGAPLLRLHRLEAPERDGRQAARGPDQLPLPVPRGPLQEGRRHRQDRQPARAPGPRPLPPEPAPLRPGPLPAPAPDDPRAARAAEGRVGRRAARAREGRRRRAEAGGARRRRHPRADRRAWRASTRRSASSPPRPWPTSTTRPAPRSWPGPPSSIPSSGPSPWRRWRRWTSRPASSGSAS